MKENKQAILLVAFGTTVPAAAEVFNRFEARVRERFPESEIRWAYTSSVVRRKLAERGDAKESVQEALERLARDGYRTIAVQSLHTIPGAEFHKLHREIVAFRHKAASRTVSVVAGSPLLAGYDDAVGAARALAEGAPAARLPHEALVCMGHGSAQHGSDLMYVAFSAILNKIDPYAFLGTVEGHPTLNDVVAQCKAANVQKAWLIPFMAVAGDHALNDMAGDDEDSWMSLLTKRDISCMPVLQGTLDNPGIAQIWLDHLAAALKCDRQKEQFTHGDDK